ncbi:antitoxin Xre/MbcA/ParS toxin-binding domain-containing protein [Dyella silvae]|uniref:antitoxin Xre/MbcA/ParS toxin-binding domain-containing protein n=1 Tax=Dyella silvae TaxID=2994424 RepID=UPI002264AB5F|nr:antitoxin Xre/MbcA/ParS toxin-binding domain-containing protein [Dyella silvae]
MLLGTEIRNEADALRVTKRGVPTANYVKFASMVSLRSDAVAPATTMRRRLEQLERMKTRRQKAVARSKARAQVAAEKPTIPVLNEAESEKAVRYARIVAEATLLFGNRDSALKWLNTPRDFLHEDKDVTPMVLAETDSGARLVESMMKRTAYGML